VATTGTPFPNPSAAARGLVFVSYSHLDRDWLDRLLVFLKPFTGPDFRVWADPYIKDGADWRRDISRVLDRSCVAVLLVSPDFLASDFIRQEELPQLLAGVDAGTISLFPIPISASNYKATPLRDHQFAHPPSRPLDVMPRPRRNAALVRITEKIAAEVERIRSEIPSAPVQAIKPVPPKPVAPVVTTEAIGALHGVPPQRPNYLRRQEYLDRLKHAVLGATDRAVGITGTAPEGARIGLHGMGGIGKTELAKDLVNDDEVRRGFPDGIFWLTLGQAIEPLNLQGELAGYMAGEARAYATVNEARDGLKKLFEDKACLLVLDDLWRSRDAEPFDVLGPRSRLLLTTRDADLLVALGARELPLDVLSEELALELLSSWSGQPRAEFPEAPRKVAESCGYLPLAMALAGARVQGGARWEEVLAALQRGRLEFLDHPYGSVFSSLRLSTDALTEAERDRYFELAVFPEDTTIPVATVCFLWHHTGGLGPNASQNLLLRLHRRALLTRAEDGTYISFHDLQHDFLRLNIASLVEAHNALIEAYRAKTPAGWASGPNDGYFFQHLPQHLVAADRLGELKALLSDYDWLFAKLRATWIGALLADYDLIAHDADLTLLQRALRLSVPVLMRDQSQLPAQLLGRLRGAHAPAAELLLAGAEHGPGRAWLFPRFASLTPPGPLLQTLVGHTGPVSVAAVFADGSRALTGSRDNTLRLWDLKTGETLRTLKGHTGPVKSVTVLAAGRRALSGSDDNTLRLWDLETGETLRTLEGYVVGVSPDGTRALFNCGFYGRRARVTRLWDLETGEVRTIGQNIQTWDHPINRIMALVDGNRALSASENNTLRLWDLSTEYTLRTLEGHKGPINAVSVFADGSLALSGSWDKTLRLWDLATGDTLRTLEGHKGPINAVSVFADGNRALSASEDNTLRLWDLATGDTLRILEPDTGGVSMVATVADEGRALSFGSWDNTLQLWDLETVGTASTLEGYTSWVNGLAILPDGRRALSGSWDNTLQLWDLETGEVLRTFEGHRGLVSTVTALADGRRALTGSRDNTLRLWDLETGRTLCTFSGHTNLVSAIMVLVGGNRALSSSLDRTLRLWDLKTGKTLSTYSGLVSALVVLADGRRALSGSPDNTLRLWDLDTGATSRIFRGHENVVNALGLLADGRRFLSALRIVLSGCGTSKPGRLFASWKDMKTR
jgi:WD40 repeat protein